MRCPFCFGNILYGLLAHNIIGEKYGQQNKTRSSTFFLSSPQIAMMTEKRSISLQQLFLYLTIISAFTGTLWLSVPIGSIHLFPYRFLLIFMWFFFVVAIFMKNGRLNLSHVKVKVYLQFLVLWMGYAFLSMTWAAAKGDAIRHVIFLFMGISIIFFIVYYLRDLDQLKWFYWLWLLIFAVLIPVGIWEVTTGNHLNVSGIFGEVRLRFRFAPSTVFYNQNDFAGYIALTLPMVLAWIRYYPKLIGRALGVSVFIAGLYLLILTFSRSCYIAVFMGILFWSLFLLRWKKRIKALALAAFVCGLLVVAFPIQTQDILAKVEIQANSLVPIVLQNEDMGSLYVRQNLIKNALYFTAKSAGFGVGAGNVEYYMENYKIYPVANITNVHNWWVEIFANYGVFIFVGYLIFYVSLFWKLWKVYKRVTNRTEKMICEALLVGLATFFMASISSSSIIAFRPQWIFFGFALAFLNYSRIQAYSNV
jgi:teichuronic acid biosynthesis protein TuaE